MGELSRISIIIIMIIIIMCRWVDNNRMDLQEMGCGYMDWIWLA